MRLLVINCDHAGDTCELLGIPTGGRVCATCVSRSSKFADRAEPIWYEKSKRSGSTAVERPAPIPRDKWGEGLNEWIAQRTDADKGVGSTLHRIGTEEAKAILIQITHGTRCRCKDRVATADALYPYALK